MKKRSMGLLVLAHAAADINQGSIPVLLPFFITQHHISYTAAATIVFAVNLVSTLAQPVFGYITDRRSRPWLIPASMLVVGLGVCLTGVMPSYALGLATLTITGLGIAVFHPEGARLMNHLAGASKATAMSLFGIGGQLGFAIGPLIGTAALLSFGLKGTMVVVIPTVIAAALVTWRIQELTEGYVTKGTAKGTQVHSEGRDDWPAFICIASALLSRSIIFYGINTFLPLYWINVLQQSKAAGGTALTVLLTSSIAGNFLGGRAADRFGYRRITVASFTLLMVMLPFLALLNDPLWATALLVPVGLVLSAPFGPMVALGQGYLPNRVGLASGITLGLAFSFGGLTTPILGWIADHHGLRATIATVTFIPVICTAFTLMLPKSSR